MPSPSIYKETGSGGLKTRQHQQERLNTKYKTALLPPSIVLHLFFLFHLLSESAEPPAVAGKHLSWVKLIPEKTQDRGVNARVIDAVFKWKSNKLLFPTWISHELIPRLQWKFAVTIWVCNFMTNFQEVSWKKKQLQDVIWY